MSVEDKIIYIIGNYLNNNQVVLGKLSGKSPRKHTDVVEFQRELCRELGGDLTTGNNVEHLLFENSRDSADIWFGSFGDNSQYELIIEIDATRADQVAKKMLSRFRYFVNSEKIPIYVALLYQGTSSMNSQECLKYFDMGANVLQRLNNNSILIGYIIGKYDQVNNLKANDETYVFNQSFSNGIKYDYNLVLSREMYRQFLYDENIKSIDNYMMPLNKIESIQDKAIFIDFLSNPSKDLNDKHNEIRTRFYNIKSELTKDQKSYWNKYISYLAPK